MPTSGVEHIAACINVVQAPSREAHVKVFRSNLHKAFSSFHHVGDIVMSEIHNISDLKTLELALCLFRGKYVYGLHPFGLNAT